jgi:hypothetical protein
VALICKSGYVVFHMVANRLSLFAAAWVAQHCFAHQPLGFTAWQRLRLHLEPADSFPVVRACLVAAFV